MKKSILPILMSVLLLTACKEKAYAQKKQVPVESKVETNMEQTVRTLSDKKATESAKNLFAYLNSIYGKQVLTGQMENAWDNSYNQLEQVKRDTGKYPALMGFDFMDYTGIGWNAKNVQTERAIAFWDGKNYDGKKISSNHGIVAFNWHWRDPLVKAGATGSFRPEEAEFRIPYDTVTKEWKTDSLEYKEMMKDLDVIAEQLLRLQKAGVPVLWRPLHEGAGNVGLYGGTGTAWFWWGAGNSKAIAKNEKVCAECYVALWKLMYEYFTQTKEIHNLIWLWNGQNAKFYPGSEYVDMIGVDIYAENGNYSSQKSSYKKNQQIDSSKMVTLSECGVIPALEKMAEDNAMWLYFMVWNDGNKSSADENFWNGGIINPLEHRKEVYDSPYAITLDKVSF